MSTMIEILEHVVCEHVRKYGSKPARLILTPQDASDLAAEANGLYDPSFPERQHFLGVPVEIQQGLDKSKVTDGRPVFVDLGNFGF